VDLQPHPHPLGAAHGAGGVRGKVPRHRIKSIKNS
jgi:hypothetical protein